MKVLIWDLPTRIFHWLLALSVILAFGIAQLAEKESSLFYVHVVFGVLAGLLILWRLVWGFVGSRHALWKTLFYSPSSILNYFKEVARGNGSYHAGHNPGSSLILLGILALVTATVLTGVFITSSELFEDLHESLPIVLMVLVGLHILGVFIATKMNHENYVLSMITGVKRGSTHEAIKDSHPLAAGIMLLIVLGLWGYFIQGFDRNSALFTAPGTQWNFQVGEPEADLQGSNSDEADTGVLGEEADSDGDND